MCGAFEGDRVDAIGWIAPVSERKLNFMNSRLAKHRKQETGSVNTHELRGAGVVGSRW